MTRSVEAPYFSEKNTMSFQMVALSEVAQPILRTIPVIPGTKYRTMGVRWWGEGAYERETIDGMQTAAKTLALIKENDLIINKIWVRNGSTAIASGKVDGCAASGEFPTFELDQTKVFPRWLHWITKTKDFWHKCDSLSRGTSGKNRIRPELFLTIEIPLPSLEEQRRIVARVEEVAAKIEKARGLRREAVEDIQRLIASSREQAFTPRPNWMEACISEFCEPPQYGYTASATTEPIGPHLLRITDIQNGQVNWNSVPYCQCPNPEQYLLRDKDIVFARTGATTGKSFLILNCTESIFASYLIRLRVKRLVSAEYLYHYFQAPSYWNQITEEKKGTGQPNVNGVKLSNIRVPIASPEEQVMIVSYLDALDTKVDTIKRLQAETSAELNALLPSILDKAFKGDL